MSFIASSVTDSLWQRITKTVAANTEIIADTFNVDNLMGRHYLITAYSKTENKSKTLHLIVAKQNALPVDSVYGKIGNEIILDVIVTDAGEVKIKNRNAFEIKLEIAKLIQGG